MAVAGAAGCRVVVLDAEHGAVRLDQIRAMVLEGRLHGVSLWVRAPGHDPAVLAGYLDQGIDGIVAPRVSSRAQAEAVVQAVRYPPRGRRGIGPTPDNGYFLTVPAADYLEAAGERIRLWVQIEDAGGAAEAEAIAAVPGIDGVLIGPLDLATSMGHAGRTTDPEVQRTIAGVAAAVRAQGKQVSLPVGPSGQAPIEVDLALGYLPELVHHAVRNFGAAAATRD